MNFPARPLPKNYIAIPKEAKLIFDGVIYQIYQWQQKMYDGTFATFERAKRKDTVEAYFVSEEGFVYLVKEEQPNGIKRFGTPGGRLEDYETPVSTHILTELKEEIGISPKRLFHLETFQPEEKIDWLIHSFVAFGVKEESMQHLDSGEKVLIVKLSIEEMVTKMINSEIELPPYIGALLLKGQKSEVINTLRNPWNYLTEINL